MKRIVPEFMKWGLNHEVRLKTEVRLITEKSAEQANNK